MKCSFCKKEIKLGTGKMYVKNDGRIYWFDKQKCEKNLFKLKRRAVKLKWTRPKIEAKKNS